MASKKSEGVNFMVWIWKSNKTGGLRYVNIHNIIIPYTRSKTKENLAQLVEKSVRNANKTMPVATPTLRLAVFPSMGMEMVCAQC